MLKLQFPCLMARTQAVSYTILYAGIICAGKASNYCIRKAIRSNFAARVFLRAENGEKVISKVECNRCEAKKKIVVRKKTQEQNGFVKQAIGISDVIRHMLCSVCLVFTLTLLHGRDFQEFLTADKIQNGTLNISKDFVSLKVVIHVFFIRRNLGNFPSKIYNLKLIN